MTMGWGVRLLPRSGGGSLHHAIHPDLETGRGEIPAERHDLELAW